MANENLQKNYVFDIELLEKLKGEKPTYSIGVDTIDKYNLAYCLCKNSDDKMEILLAKTTADKKEFKEEVENLSKYFNAEIYGEL
jgi:hypothetical protein